jgi:hypothetical protein
MCLAAAALAAPQDSISFTSQVSNGTNGSALNQVSQNNLINAYPVHRVRVTGTLVSGGVNSYASEARILVTPPTGAPFTLQPFSVPGPFGTVTTPVGGYVYDLPSIVSSSHGTWTWRFYESFDDAGIDATWSNISFTLDDGTGSSNLEAHATAPAAIAGVNGSLISMYIVPGTNPASTGITATMNLSNVGGSVAQALYDDGTHGDVVAGDHIYSFQCSPSASANEGNYNISYHVTDAQGRSLLGAFPFQVQGVTDMGDLSGDNGWIESATTDVLVGGVHWFKVTIPAVAAVSTGWFDIRSDGPVGGDTEIALYNASGALMGSDDDDGNGTLSALSFGQASPRIWDNGDILLGDGRDGALPAGTYYLAFGTYPMTFASSNFGVTAGGPAATGGDVQFWLYYRTNPTVTGDTAVAPPQGTVLLTAHPLPGFDPISDGLNVSVDLNAFGGATPAMYDDGTHGDVYAGDGVFSLLYMIPAGYGEGTYTLPLLVRDSIFRQGTGTATVIIDAAGETPATAKVLNNVDGVHSISGVITDQDVDMYRIHICDPSNFSAVVTAASFDTELSLFRLDGTGIALNDDTLSPYSVLSRLDGPFVTNITPGDYYMAITSFGNRALDASAQLIWNFASYPATAPNGPGAANPIASWNHLGLAGGTYTIAVTGVNGRACPPTCTADFNGDGDIGTDADIEAFFACLAGTCCPTCGSPDFNGDGDVGTDADIEAFFRVLAGGTC